MKFAICNEIFKDWPIRKQFEAAAEIGFDGIEISPFTLNDLVTEITDEQKAEIVACAKDTGVAVAGIHWLLVGPKGLHVTDPDPAVRERTRDYFCELVKFGLAIGGEMMVVGSPVQRAVKPGVTECQAWEWFKEAMAQAAQVPGAEAFRVCIEPLAVITKNNFLFKADQAKRMAQEINLPNVGVTVDTYSGPREEADLPEAIRATGEYLFHYHCNDFNGRAPGWGDTDFVPIMQALQDINFPHYCSIEVFDMTPDPYEHAKKGLETLKAAL
jgi:sugar phosphate isomerase/epimerase